MKLIILKSHYFGFELRLRVSQEKYAALLRSDDPMRDINMDEERLRNGLDPVLLSEGQHNKIRRFFEKGNSEYFDKVFLATDKSYRIVAKCDPYNARMHYHGEPVLKRDGATPVVWLFNNHEHLSLKEANQVILDLASMTAERKLANWSVAVRCLGKYVQGADCGTNDDGTRCLHDDSMTYVVEEE